MNKMVNEQVISNWKHDKPARNHKGTLRTDGKSLWSYELLIGNTCSETGLKVASNYTARGKRGYYSQTTSCHVGLAIRVADVIDG